MILSRQSILARRPIKHPEPRTEVHIGGKRFTHGVGPAGYDLSLYDVLDVPVEHMDGNALGSVAWRLAPGQFALAVACEEFDMPDDLIGVVHDKSSWARRGLAVQNTVIEPGWNGYLTLEFTNHGGETILLPRGVGICQVIFHVLDQPTNQPYTGKYQGQPKAPIPAR